MEARLKYLLSTAIGLIYTIADEKYTVEEIDDQIISWLKIDEKEATEIGIDFIFNKEE